jgi:TorA maturation chaperone TorD
MNAAMLAPEKTMEWEAMRVLERSGIYRILGGALAYPVAGCLKELRRLAATAGTLTVAPELRDLLVYLFAAVCDADPAALAEEYMFLFDREARCPPYEGAYGEAAQMAGKAAQLADIAGFYATFGLVPSALQPDVEDHIAAELEFMSVLALKEAHALAGSDAEGVMVTRGAQVAFLTDHLGRWAETFAEALRAATPLPYYGAVADLLAAWVRAEIDARGATPGRLAGRFGRDSIQEEERFTCPMADPAAEGN